MEAKDRVQFLKKTVYMVTGDNMGPSKRTKANELQISLISKDDYLKMI